MRDISALPRVLLHDKYRLYLLKALTSSIKKYTLAAGQQLGTREAVGLSMMDTWISPWSDEQLTADELIREVALDTLSQMYLVSLLGLPNPSLSIEPDAVIVKSSAIDYEYDIPYPRVLSDRMSESFADTLATLKEEYRIIDGTKDVTVPNGDKIGSMLRYFKSMERLIRIVTAVRCWSEHKVLAVHGLPAEYSAATFESDLRGAGFHFLVIYPSGDTTGSGNFRAIRMGEAITLVNSLWPRQPGVVEEFFNLGQSYGNHLWISDDNTWTSEGSMGRNESQRITRN